MANKYYGTPALCHIVHLPHTLLLKLRIPYSQHFVDDQYLGVEVGGDGEREPDVHARRVALDGGIEKLFGAGEVDDGVELAGDLALPSVECWTAFLAMLYDFERPRTDTATSEAGVVSAKTPGGMSAGIRALAGMRVLSSSRAARPPPPAPPPKAGEGGNTGVRRASAARGGGVKLTGSASNSVFESLPMCGRDVAVVRTGCP